MIDSPSRRSSRRASALNAGEKNGSALDVSRSPGRDARSRASAKAEVRMREGWNFKFSVSTGVPARARARRPHRLTAREFDDDAGEDGDGGDAGTRKTRANRTRGIGGDEERRGDDDGKSGFADAEEREVHRARGGGEWDVRWEGRERCDEEVGYCERARGGGAASGGEADTEETVERVREF